MPRHGGELFYSLKYKAFHSWPELSHPHVHPTAEMLPWECEGGCRRLAQSGRKSVLVCSSQVFLASMGWRAFNGGEMTDWMLALEP